MFTITLLNIVASPARFRCQNMYRLLRNEVTRTSKKEKIEHLSPKI